MKTILHLPTEIAAQVGLQVAGLVHAGWQAQAILRPHPFAYPHSTRWECRESRNPVLKSLQRLGLFARTTGRYDLYHYHFGDSLLPRWTGHLDARINRRLGRRAVAQFWGSEIRKPSVEQRRNPFYVNGYNEADGDAERTMALWAGITGGHVIYADHSSDITLKAHFDRIHVVPQAVDTDALRPSFPSPEQLRPLVVHIPSQRAAKGTDAVREAVAALQAKRVAFEYREVSGVSYQEAMNLCAQADLVIDQLRLGSHGVFACEAMALGKPVICQILDELLPGYPENLPLINADPRTICRVLEEWLTAPAERRFERGRASREYAVRRHDYRVVAGKLLEVYAQLPA